MSFKKGVRILRNYGLASFVKRFFVFLSQNMFTFKKYNFYKKSLNDSKKIDVELKGIDPILVIIHNSSKLNKFIEDGYDFGPYQDIHDVRKFLNDGAILFCIFYRKKWAHSSWASLENGSIVDPFFRNFQHQYGGYIGTCSTHPDYRGMGLYPHVLSKICDFFEIKGKSFAVISTTKMNFPSIAGISKAGFYIYSEGYNLNIGGFKFWVVQNP